MSRKLLDACAWVGLVSLGLVACSLNDLDSLDGAGGATAGASGSAGTKSVGGSGGSGSSTNAGGTGGLEPVCGIGGAFGEKPYGGTAREIPGSIESEDYDEGGQGAGYRDLSPGNEGHAYRNDDVDIKAVGSGNAIGWFQSGEWLAYTIDVKSAGKYRFDFRVGAPEAGRTFKLNACGVDVGGDIAVPQTSSWGEVVGSSRVDLQACKLEYSIVSPK